MAQQRAARDGKTAEDQVDDRVRTAKKGQLADFSFKGLAVHAKVVDVYDGDTLRLVFVYRGELIQYAVRMEGYDSPEMRPAKTHPTREAEKQKAYAAKEALVGRTADRVLVAELGEFDKYGRPLAKLYLTEELAERSAANCVNTWMVENGYGQPYFGGTKPKGGLDSPSAKQ
jgi:endonuclease YncB( thermonuclease family)